MKMKRFIAALVLFFLAACASHDSVPRGSSDTCETCLTGVIVYNLDARGVFQVERFTDTEQGVVCYVLNAPSRGGISCLKLEKK